MERMPIGSVKFSLEVKKIAGDNISFHLVMNVKTAKVAKVGLHIGRNIFQYI
ncbi:hypothetical protein D3C77_615260 [compost metagenome]